jgi:glycosyltransferase involved in cell wall biosynthesis
LKIAINAVSAKMGGAVTYLSNVLRCLPPPDSGHEFHVFLPPETAEKQVGLAGNIHLLPTKIGRAKWWKRLWWEQATLRRHLKKYRVDALFSTANFGMFHCPVRQILLIRTRLYFSKIYLETFLPPYSLRFRASFRLRRWLCCRSIRWADVVMTPTQAMLEELRVYADCPLAKTVVNLYGVAASADGDNAHTLPKGDSSPFRLLYISLYAEHKNLTTLLKALPLVNRDASQTFVLMTTVNPNWEEASRILTHKGDIDLARRRDIAPWVKFVGPFGKKAIEEQYRNADIFVFPSLTESFGHPMVEAMAHGLPVVAADTPVNRELCGDAAIYFSPFEPDHLAQAIHRVAMDPTLRRRLGLEGQRRVRTIFRWDAHVRRILEIARAEQPEVLQESSQDSLTQRGEECLLPRTSTNRPV